MTTIEKYPTFCNLCGESVVYSTNADVYGKEYGSGKCYRCLGCGAYVGTHKPKPREALGLLADKEMRELKMKCHDLFDPLWQKKKKKSNARKAFYMLLAVEMKIPPEACHFGYFNKDKLQQALDILKTWRRGNA